MARMGAARWCPIVTTWLIVATASTAASAADGRDAVGPSPSLTGATGLLRVSTTDIGAAGSVRVALYGGLSRANDVLVLGDTNTKVAADVAGGFALRRHVELFGAVRAARNRNEQNATPAGAASASTVWSGGFDAGAKVATPLRPGLAGGGELGVRLPFDAGSWPSSGAAWITAIGSLDLAARTFVLLRVHLNLGFYADGSRNQIEFTGQSASARQVSMFAYGMGASRVRSAVGIDAPLESLTGRLGLRPFAEYHVEFVVAPADAALSDQSPYNRDQHWLTFGLRARAAANITAIAGFDLTVRQIGIPFGPPLPPWSVFAGAAAPFQF